MILATGFKLGVNPLEWKIIPTFDLGPLDISPHGVGIAVGYFIGAHYLVRRARRLGGPDEADLWNAIFWGLVGAILGARIGYVLGHLSEVTDGGSDPLGVFKVWEGGISLLGGITGGILLALPYLFRKRMGFWRTFDLVAPALALGIAIGRIGDLIIGDHIGKPTSFFLGWRCLGEVGGGPPRSGLVYREALEAGSAPSLGCFDIAVHQTALYDLISTLALFGVLLWLGRRQARTDLPLAWLGRRELRRGLLTLVFPIWYGTVRIITDFLRVDKRYFGLTGSQILSLIVVAVCLYLLVRYRGAPERERAAERGAAAAEVGAGTSSEEAPADAEPSAEAEARGEAEAPARSEEAAVEAKAGAGEEVTAAPQAVAGQDAGAASEAGAAQEAEGASERGTAVTEPVAGAEAAQESGAAQETEVVQAAELTTADEAPGKKAKATRAKKTSSRGGKGEKAPKDEAGKKAAGRAAGGSKTRQRRGAQK